MNQKLTRIMSILLALALASMACKLFSQAEETTAPLPPTSTPVAQAATAIPPTAAAVPATETPLPPTTGIDPGWYMYTNGNHVNEIAVYGGKLWAATGGGIVVWDLASGEALKYTVLDGLPVNNMEAVTACPIPEMRIIFGHEAGLTLIDPATDDVEHWNTKNSGMSKTSVNTLDCDVDTQTLMIGYTFGLEVLSASNGEWKLYDKQDGLVTDWVGQAAVIGSDIWVVSSFGESVIHEDGTVTGYSEKLENIPDENISGVAVDANGDIWLAAFDGLLKYSDGDFKLYNSDNTEKFPYLDAFTGIAAAPDGSVWVGNTFGTLCQFDPVSERCLAIYENEPGMVGDLDDLILDEDGNLYYCDDNEGISRFDGSSWQAYTLEELPPSNKYRVISMTEDGTIMVGGDWGLWQFASDEVDQPWKEIDVQQNFVYSFFPTPEGMWVGHTGGGSFLEYSSGMWKQVSTGDPGQGIKGSPQAITVDGAGKVWFGTSSGLTVWDGSSFTYYDLLNEQEKADNRSPRGVNALLYDGSSVWVGAYSALFRFDADGNMTRWSEEFKSLLSLSSPSTYAIAQDQDGSLLLGMDRKLVRYQDEQFTEIFEAESSIKTIVVDPSGDYWLGSSDNGIYAYSEGQWSNLTTADGLPSSHFDISQSILVDNLGTLWLAGEEGGLARYVP
ncbi:MAG: hypothetical protein AB1894_23660 [Chloroflexota bacterium]